MCKSVDLRTQPLGTRAGFCQGCGRVYCLDCVIKYIIDNRCISCHRSLVWTKVASHFPLFSLKFDDGPDISKANRKELKRFKKYLKKQPVKRDYQRDLETFKKIVKENSASEKEETPKKICLFCGAQIAKSANPCTTCRRWLLSD